MRDAKQQDGKPVIDPSTSNDVSDGVATNISSLHGVAADNFPPGKVGNVFAVAESPRSNSSSGPQVLKHTQLGRIAVPLVPPNTAVGGTITNGSIHPMSPHATAALLHAAKFSFNPVDIAGDVWHHLEQIGGTIAGGIKDGLVKLDNGISFVISHVDDALSFVLKLADKVVTIALKTLGLIFKALNYVFKLVGIDISKLLRWLGHLIGWDEVWDTHKVIASYIRNGVDFATNHGIQYLELAKSSIDAAFDGFEDRVRAVMLPQTTADNTLPATKSVAPSQQSADMNSPQMNFAAYHLNQGQAQATDSEPDQSKPSLSLSALYDQFLEPMTSTLLKKMGATGEDVLHLLLHGSTDDLKRVLFDAIDTMIAVVKQFLDSALDLAKDMLGTLDDVLNSDLAVPVIGPIYEFVTMLFGDEESFSVINGVSFLIAIPVTIAMKIFDLGSFAASEAAKRISAPGGVTDLVEQAKFHQDSQIKVALRAAEPSSAGKRSTRALLSDPSPPGPTPLDQESAAALALLSSTTTTLNSVLTAEVALLGPKPFKGLMMGFQLFGTFSSAPIWPHKLGKDFGICFLRWMRWVYGAIGSLVTCAITIADGDKKITTTVNLISGLLSTLFMFIINALDGPPPPYHDEGWASDVLLNVGTVGRNAGLLLKMTGGADQEAIAITAFGASAAVAGAGMGLHLAAENWKKKEEIGGANFAAAMRHWP